MTVFDQGWMLRIITWINGTGYRLQEAGDIIYTLDATAPTNCLELDGSTITGGAATYPKVAARYTWMVSGSDLIMPDARGRFMRVWDNGAGTDPDAASRTARAGDSQTGDYPGTYQADGAPDISGTFSLIDRSSGSSQIYTTTGPFSTSGNSTSSNLVALSGTGNGTRVSFDASSANSKYGAGTDIRPFNINVSAWMVMA